MENYQNLSGTSGVIAFEIRDSSILVQFRNTGIYIYSYRIPGRPIVEKMKVLARQGRGLSTFITRHVKDSYEYKL